VTRVGAVRRRPLLVALGVVAFLAISFQLARLLTGGGAERSAIVGLLQAQARGDAAGVAARLEGCAPDPACRRRVERLARELRRPGDVDILRLDSGIQARFVSQTGTSRVAWAADAEQGGRAVVQCVQVRREWSFAAGASITLLRLGPPIGGTSDC
jgi:hypothetical protein